MSGKEKFGLIPRADRSTADFDSQLGQVCINMSTSTNEYIINLSTKFYNNNPARLKNSKCAPINVSPNWAYPIDPFIKI